MVSNKSYLLSICIPSYNRFLALNQTVDRILSLCDDRIQIAITDNCSDNLSFFEKYEKLENVKIIRNSYKKNGIQNIRDSLQNGDGLFSLLCLDKDTINEKLLIDFCDTLEKSDCVGGFCAILRGIDSSGSYFIHKGCLSRVGYLSKHPSGYFYRKSLINFDDLNYYSADEKYNPFSYDCLISFLSTQGRLLIYKAGLIITESPEQAFKNKTLTYSKKGANKIFFFPRERRKQCNIYLGHLLKMSISRSEYCKTVLAVFYECFVDNTVGFKRIMANIEICEHYSIKTRKVFALEMFAHALSCIFFIIFNKRTKLYFWHRVKFVLMFVFKRQKIKSIRIKER